MKRLALLLSAVCLWWAWEWYQYRYQMIETKGIEKEELGVQFPGMCRRQASGQPVMNGFRSR